ncbi:ABC transporter ATP-binding protein [Eremococcus coleocola]|uniref:ABC transporter ATP-binding protein n=1 Tax=Eremococcus coleocola TaxID=88132 RepID=UPI00041B0BE3|nr:ABC transporter ATP-binding protein [Eremococcus coleocola]
MTVKVKVKDLSIIYDNGDGVRDVNLDIYENEILTLLGPSGCGKTTILRAIGGFNKVTQGSILIDDQEITNLEPEDRPTGMVFQGYNLWPHMSVYDNLAFGLKLRKVKKVEIKEKIKNVLDLVKLPGIEKKYPAQLSGGQQQRVAIARSILLEPAVLLLDEPFSALDAKIRQEMRLELKRIQQDLNLTVVFVTHDQEEAMSISDRIVVMDKGHISQLGTPNEIYDNPQSQYVASFIGAMNFLPTETGQIMAIRLEDVLVGPASMYEQKAEVEAIMLVGHYAILSLKTQNNQHLQSYVTRTESAKYLEGNAISYQIAKYQMYDKKEALQ